MQRSGKRFLTLAVTASLLLGASIGVTPATATEATFSFTGKLFEATDYLSNGQNPRFFTGTESVSGTFTLESTTPDLQPFDLLSGRYSNGVKDFTINIGGGPDVATLGASGFHRIDIKSNSYAMTVPLTGPTLVLQPVIFGEGAEAVPVKFTFGTLHGSSVYDPNHLGPPTLNSLAPPPVGSTEGVAIFRVFFDGDPGQARLSGNMLTVAPVPLPPGVILFGAGLLALAGLHARKWWQKQPSLA